MLRQQNDLLLVISFSLVLLVITLLGGINPIIQVVFALPMVLLLPGYAMTAAIFTNVKLGVPARLLFILGLSLAVTIASGLVLNFTPWGYRTASWAILLPGVTIVASLIAFLRRTRGLEIAAPTTRISLNLRQGLFLGASGLIILGAWTLTHTPRPPTDLQGYTSLWILPGNSQQNTVQLGIHSQEFGPTSYRLQLTEDGKVVHEWSDIALLPGEKWEQSIALPPGQKVGGLVEANLYRSDSPASVYRHVTLLRSQ